MTNPEREQADSIDFDPNADYLKEVTERGADTNPSSEAAIDPLFEQRVASSVAESINPHPDPVAEREIERVRAELGLGTPAQVEETPTPEKQPDIEILLRMMQNDRKDYEEIMTLFSTAREQYDDAVAKYGRDDRRTFDKKNQWDYVGRVKAEKGEKIASWMAEYPEHKEIFRIKDPS